MDNFSEITLLIPTHNRKAYLTRIIEYYQQSALQIIIVDSSAESYGDFPGDSQITYYHLPGINLPQKLSIALEKVNTRFVVMCADDDFIIPAGIITAMDFLNTHSGFVSAQGSSISYKKQKKYNNYVELNRMYSDENLEISTNDPFERMEQLFQPYRTIFSAVHYTEILRKGYSSMPDDIQNLFLNEYITAIVPIVSGKHKQLDIFYQVREYAFDSGDKTTDNLDVIYSRENYKKQLDIFLDYMAKVVSGITRLSLEYCRKRLDEILKVTAEELKMQKLTSYKPDITKRIGNLIQLIPVVGKDIVIRRRLSKQKSEIAEIVKTPEDHKQLDNIRNIIFKYGESVA